MIDLHSHTVFSDGVLIPAELARRAKIVGYQCLAITDHTDATNISWILDNVLPGLKQMQAHLGLVVLAGLELTHVPPPIIPELVRAAREKGAQLVVVHGETIVEPVETGTNLAAIEAGVDILAHPGLITPEEVELAARNKVCLEISTRKGHSLTNGYVASLARQWGANLVINNDAHEPKDILPVDLRKKVALGAGLTEEEYHQAERNSREIVEKIIKHSL